MDCGTGTGFSMNGTVKLSCRKNNHGVSLLLHGHPQRAILAFQDALSCIKLVVNEAEFENNNCPVSSSSSSSSRGNNNAASSDPSRTQQPATTTTSPTRTSRRVPCAGTFAVQQQQQGQPHRLRHQDNGGSSSSSSSSESPSPPLTSGLTELGSSAGCCTYIYGRPILLEVPVTPPSSPGFECVLSFYSASILFNLALSCHHVGLVNGREGALRRATMLYKMCSQLLLNCETSNSGLTSAGYDNGSSSPSENDDEGVDPMDTSTSSAASAASAYSSAASSSSSSSSTGELGTAPLILALLALNNRAQIHYETCEYAESSSCLRQISKIMTDQSQFVYGNLPDCDVEGLLLNVMLLEAPTAAHAA